MLAKARYQLVDDLTASIIEPARATLARKEDAKKKVRYPCGVNFNPLTFFSLFSMLPFSKSSRRNGTRRI
jgi:hypothetical protein